MAVKLGYSVCVPVQNTEPSGSHMMNFAFIKTNIPQGQIHLRLGGHV